MRLFSSLLDRLLHTPQRNAKLRLLVNYLKEAPDPDRGYAIAALTSGLNFKHAKAGLVRELITRKTDPVLFGWSYDFVGDLAETTALMWPASNQAKSWPSLATVVESLGQLPKPQIPKQIEAWLDAIDVDGRWALLKLLTGGMRVGVSARLAKLALAHYGSRDVGEIEEVWHGLKPPFTELFQWLDGLGPIPSLENIPVFRPLMLANPLAGDEVAKLDLNAYTIEWKWDGIRVQIASVAGEVRLYSRSGDDISKAFPDVVHDIDIEGVLDGELLIIKDGEVSPFSDLQQRLNRKTVTTRLMSTYPAAVRLYDVLFDGTKDVRQLSLVDRRARLARIVETMRSTRFDVSPLVDCDDQAHLSSLRASCRGDEREGLMLKHRDSVYSAGRPKGPWFKWKRDPLFVDCVLMYAQRGHGKRSSFYSDFTFGAWRDAEQGRELVPVGKSYFGYTDEELVHLDKWIRNHTTNRFGPVREVKQQLVFEVAFDSIHRSKRHKSGVAMRFPRIHRIRWDKPAREADELHSLEAMIG